MIPEIEKIDETLAWTTDGNCHDIDTSDESMFLSKYEVTKAKTLVPSKYYLLALPRIKEDGVRYYLFRGKELNPGLICKHESIDSNIFMIERFIYVDDLNDYTIYNTKDGKYSYINYSFMDINDKSNFKSKLIKSFRIPYYNTEFKIEEFNELNENIAVYINIKYGISISDILY